MNDELYVTVALLSGK